MKKITLCLMLLPIAGPAYADEAETPAVMQAENCFSIEGIRETLLKFDSLKPEKRDRVGPDIGLTITLDDGEIMPERRELRDGDKVTAIAFDDDQRTIGLTEAIRGASETAELCSVDPARAGRLVSERGYAVEFGMGVRFIDTPGTHSMDEIEDGLKDGRSHYKKMAGAMGFMVPKFDHIAVAGQDESNPPRVWATQAGADIGEPEFELYDGARMIDLDVLEDMDADGIRIEGDYRMTPSPDAKTVAKFAGSDD